MKKLTFITLMLFLLTTIYAKNNNTILVEAESFAQKGGWVVDQQSMDIMGSPYLMAHGMGIPVRNATTTVQFPKTGTYHVFVRTRNWAGRWNTTDAPGKFKLIVDSSVLEPVFGTESDEWSWQKGGSIEIKSKTVSLTLKDLTGFNGRCDAILFSSDPNFIPPLDTKRIETLRAELNPTTVKPKNAGTFDFVVVGGGMAGTCAAISAARLGLKVALIQDRPVLGGNNSSEVRVHLGGRIRVEPFPAIGNLVNEIGPAKEGNAQPKGNYEDDKKILAIEAEKNISLFLNHRANVVNMKNGRIMSIEATDIQTGEKKLFIAPLFADCTGDATIGTLAGAKYMTGRESARQYGETRAPEKTDSLTMGSSVQWFAIGKANESSFPDIKWGLPWNESKTYKITRGDWDWETGMGMNQLTEIERIRDYGLMVVYSNWSYLKNNSQEKDLFARKQLEWVAYVAGKRESKRLVGDYILTETDLTKANVYPDGTASTTWTIDLHTPDPENSRLFLGAAFKSIAEHTAIYPYPIPFRCLYSVNVPNLMMAGRNISVTHVALGTVRLMRTGGMMGEVLGMAASICKKEKTDPRGVYQNYLPELVKLMKKGIGKANIPNTQKYNEGGTLLKNVNKEE
ncbi:MAG: FAD-dependent oxidoreductase [Bacteroidota bacterium]|nr:FAD-dependent oxidoreductase [Bacteroidota bacterium]